MLSKIFVAAALALLPLAARAQLTLYLGKLNPRVTIWALKDEATQAYLGSESYEWAGPAPLSNPFDLNAPVLLPPDELQRLHQQIAAKLHLPESTIAGAKHETMETKRKTPPGMDSTQVGAETENPSHRVK